MLTSSKVFLYNVVIVSKWALITNKKDEEIIMREPNQDYIINPIIDAKLQAQLLVDCAEELDKLIEVMKKSVDML